MSAPSPKPTRRRRNHFRVFVSGRSVVLWWTAALLTGHLSWERTADVERALLTLLEGASSAIGGCVSASGYSDLRGLNFSGGALSVPAQDCAEVATELGAALMELREMQASKEAPHADRP